jgi:6-hydroxymethylpterin diphosphokinase MptE-like protein
MGETNRLGQSLYVLRNEGLTSLCHRTLFYFLLRISRLSGKGLDHINFATCRRRAMRDCGTVLNRNEIFRDCHKGRRCFVVGNGPSLNQQNLSPLGDEITLVTNYFYRHPLVQETWQPGYYFLSDPNCFDGITVGLEEFSRITEAIPSAPFFVPHYARDFLVATSALPEDRTYYMATCGGTEEKWQGRPDLTKTIPGAQSVVQLAIMVAMYMGCSPIYLLGLDHDWLSHGGQHLDFYNEAKAENQPQGNLPGWTYRSMMEAMLTMWNVYEMLARIARHEGIQIINSTRGGFLDVFERQSYESIINRDPSARNNDSAHDHDKELRQVCS